MNAVEPLVAAAPAAGTSLGPEFGGGERRRHLLPEEAEALAGLTPRALRRNRSRGVPRRTAASWHALSRLVGPLDEARLGLQYEDDDRCRRGGRTAVAVILANCAELERPWWAWTSWDWARLIGPSSEAFLAAQPLPTDQATRPFLIALGHVLADFTDFQHLGNFNRVHLARLVFGADRVTEAINEVGTVLERWGYRSMIRTDGRYRLHGVLAQALLINHSPRLTDLTTQAFADLHAHPASTGRYPAILYSLQKIVAELGYCDSPIRPGYNHAPGLAGVPQPWADLLQRWYDTSALTPNVRSGIRVNMAKAGRWAAAKEPHAIDPRQWTRTTCASWIAAIDRMVIGDWVQRTDHLNGRIGTPILPRTKSHILMASRMFFRDLQEWEWIPRRFDPARALATPRTINALISTDPRVIADDVWAKLLWAGLNLQPADFPGTYYPLELIRALTLTWLFSGLRSDELSRLRVGCVRWQHDGTPISGDSKDVLADDAVCLLDVPVHKTGTAFTKPVDPLVGHAIETWQMIRPDQPKRLDRKTSEHVDLLFSIRAHPVAKSYINQTLIPALCVKAGVPTTDVRGNITSHRARSTIASQLYNAKEPMTLFELQAWLGHRSPNTTQHYAKITPNTLTKAYTEAGYFARNVRTIEVLLDREAVASGEATDGQPWQYYDLGHGLCSYTFFEQCPHRMACAKCDFYLPKNSTKAQILEAKDNLQRMLATVPLTDDEQAAVNDGQAALDTLLDRLADVPTPTGATPRQLGSAPAAAMLPIIEVRQHKQD